MSDPRIDEVVIPAAIDSPVAPEFVRMIELGNVVEAAAIGTDDLFQPSEQLPSWHDQENEPRRAFVARVDGEIVGRGLFETTSDSDSPTAWLTIDVLPEFRRRGIGSALYEHLLQVAEGRTVLQAYVLYGPDVAASPIPSPTGFGAVPSTDPGSAFLTHRGFALGQVERFSRLPLPADVTGLLAPAKDAAGPDYDVVAWAGATPDEYLADVAALRTRMATDAPWAGIEPDMTAWDAERLREYEALDATGGRTLMTAAAIHLPSGRVVGMTQHSVPPERSRAVSQYDTLVHSDHRGHRLGMWLKAANLAQLEKVAPGHPSVSTYNAEENRHMLAVNEALGFVAVGYEGAWRKDLQAPSI